MDKLQKKFSFLTSSSIYVYSLTGLILIGFGVLAYKIDIFSSGDKVEILLASPSDGSQGGNVLEITVEIVGAVEKAGVYSFKEGSRVDDLLIAAGGLSAGADRDWVTKNINRAAKLNDGQKIYIYQTGESHEVLGIARSDLAISVNINTASLEELEKLPEIGRERGKSIIEHRPYSDVQELVTKGVISQKILEKIKNEITVY